MGSHACNPSTYGDRSRNILVHDGLGFHSEFQAKQGYIVRAYLKEKKAKLNPKTKNTVVKFGRGWHMPITPTPRK